MWQVQHGLFHDRQYAYAANVNSKNIHNRLLSKRSGIEMTGVFLFMIAVIFSGLASKTPKAYNTFNISKPHINSDNPITTSPAESKSPAPSSNNSSSSADNTSTNSTNTSTNSTSVTVNGVKVPVPSNGTTHQVISTADGSVTVNTNNTSTGTSTNHSSTSSSVNVSSSSSSSSIKGGN